MFFKKEELSLLWPFYLEALIAPILFFYPAFMNVYFIKIGLSLFQIGTILAAYSLAILIFEIPTGSFADIYGRKGSVILGGVISGSALLLLFIFREYWAILILFGIIGLGRTFTSGANEAWEIDLIKTKNKNLLKDFMTKKHSIGSIGIVMSGLIGAFFVYSLDVSIIWIFGALSFFISSIILMFAKEHFQKRKSHVQKQYNKLGQQTKKGINYAYKHHVIFWLFIASFIIAFALSANSRLVWIPFLKNYGLADYLFGYLWSVMGIMGIIGPIISHKLLKEINNEKKLLIVIWGFYFLTMVWILFVYEVIIALFIMIATAFFVNARWPVQRIYLHRFIPSRIRATIGSIESIIVSVGYMIASVVVGYVADTTSPRQTLFLSAILIIPVIVIYLRINESPR